MVTHYALEVQPYIDRGGEALIICVSADTYSPRAGATFGLGRKLLGVQEVS
jgi:hypothetical protein